MTQIKCDIPANTRVLVTGATGFTGSVLIRKLAAAGLRVSAIARASSNTEHLADLDIRWHKGNVYDPATVDVAARDAQYIFHVAAAYREAKLTDEDYRKVHVTSTKLLANAAATNPRFKRFVHISTVGVHSHIENPPADENYPFQPADIYQKTKAEAELWIRNFAEEKNLPITVLRPAAIYGPGDRRLFKVFKMASWRFFPILGHGKCLYHLIHVDDLTDIMIHAATAPAALNDVFICGNPTSASLDEIATIVSTERGLDTKIVRMPAWPFFVAGHLCEFICRPFGIEPPIYPRRVAFYTKDRSFDTRKLQNTLDFKVKYSNEEGLRQTTRWYVDNRWLT